jgi:Beta-propeller repeat
MQGRGGGAAMLAAACVTLASGGIVPGQPPADGRTASASLIRPAAGWFEPNVGQSPADAKFIGRTQGGSIAVLARGLRLSVPNDSSSTERRPVQRGADVMAMPRAVIAIDYVHTDSAARVSSVRPIGLRVSYLRGPGDEWHASLPTSTGVAYRELWRGVDLDLDIGDGLKGTYTIAPHQDPHRIVWRYRGATARILGGEVRLTPFAGGPSLVEHRPLAWQVTPRGRVPVAAGYVMRTDGAVGFVLGDYDASRPLVIDPAISWTTRVGGLPFGEAHDVAYLPDGDVVAIGEAQAPERAGESANSDVWVARFHGVHPVWVVHLGGGATDFGAALEVDDSGRIGVAGTTWSIDFPTTTGYGAATSPSSGDAFAALLQPNGNLVWATYLSGPGLDTGLDAKFSHDGALLVAGATGTGGTDPQRWSCLPASEGAVAYSRCIGFVTRLAPDGRVGWTALIGQDVLGDVEEASGGNIARRPQGEVAGIAVDVHDDVYLVGSTQSRGLPTTPGAVQPVKAGPSGDETTYEGFVGRLSADGRALPMLTYLGGLSDDRLVRAEVDPAGGLIVLGHTDSADFPTQPQQVCALHAGATADGVPGRSRDLVAVKLSVDGSKLAYSTCLGGSTNDDAYDDAVIRGDGLAVDPAGNSYVLGTTGGDFPLRNAWQARYAGPLQATQSYSGGDFVVVKLTPTGVIDWASYLGGPSLDSARGGLAVGQDGSLTIATLSVDSEFPGTTEDPDNSGDKRVVLTRITAPLSPTPSPTLRPDPTESSSAAPTNGPSPGSSSSAPPNEQPPSAAVSAPATTASPSATPDATAGRSEDPQPVEGTAPSSTTATCSTPGSLVVYDAQVSAGHPARVRFHGTPGSDIRIDGYSRVRGRAPAYGMLRPRVTVPSTGYVEFTFRPTTNTRLRAVGSCGTTDSVVLGVSLRLSLVATCSGGRTCTMWGRIDPTLPSEGRVIGLYYYAPDRRRIRKAVAVVHGGVWRVAVRFTMPGTLAVVAAARPDLVNRAGSSPARTVVIG